MERNDGFVYQEVDAKGQVIADPGFCVFVTPRQVIDLDIGLHAEDFPPEGIDEVQPFVVDGLVEMTQEYLFGLKKPVSPYYFPVEGAMCQVTLCLDINGKLCRLDKSELDWPNPFTGLNKKHQVATFQRLLNEQQITLEDLAAVDIDLAVYKQLCINDEEGDIKWHDTLMQIGKWIVQQKNSKRWGKYFKRYKGTPKLKWWEDIATDIE